MPKTFRMVTPLGRLGYCKAVLSQTVREIVGPVEAIGVVAGDNKVPTLPLDLCTTLFGDALSLGKSATLASSIH
ncbi:MAG: hypothetical protein ACOC58_00240 [Chloroflexota bacterium]